LRGLASGLAFLQAVSVSGIVGISFGWHKKYQPIYQQKIWM
jgi:hypothetical protein